MRQCLYHFHSKWPAYLFDYSAFSALLFMIMFVDGPQLFVILMFALHDRPVFSSVTFLKSLFVLIRCFC